MRVLILSFLCCLSIVFISNAQAVVGEPNQYESTWRSVQVIRDILNKKSKDNPIDFKDIKGSPYLNQKFKMGEYVANGKSLGNFYLRYNIYSDEIEVIDEKELNISDGEIKDLGAFLKIDDSHAIIDNQKFNLVNYVDKNDDFQKAYFQELYSNNGTTLLKRFRCVLTPAQKAQTFNEADRAAKFNIYEDYYLQTKESQYPELLSLKKSKIVKAFKGKEKSAKEYIATNKLNLKKEDDLVKLIQFVSEQ